jgi:hypothetical protein
MKEGADYLSCVLGVNVDRDGLRPKKALNF